MGRRRRTSRAGWGAVVLAVTGVVGGATLAVSSPASASPTTFYVAVGGSDAGNCESASAPCATIGYAVSQAPADVGGTIDIGPGTFPASVSLSSMSGTVTFQGTDASGVSGGTVVEAGTSMGTTFGANRSHLNLDQLTVNGLNGDAVDASYGATVTIVDSTITNSADAVTASGPVASVTVSASTLAGNTVGVDAADPSSGIDITDSTIADNNEGITGTIDSTSVAGSIVADNSGGDCAATTGTLTDAGYNDNGDGSCGFSATDHSLPATDPELGPLQDNGGPTETAEPAFGGPVTDQVPPGTTGNSVTLCPGLDQRGVARPQGTDCDMGAVEDSVPQVSGVFPPTGLVGTSTSVNVTGSGFLGATQVYFGGASASFVVDDDNTITATSPSGSPGAVDVTVVAPTGTSLVNPADTYTYTVNQSPTVVGCAPACTDTVSSPDDSTSITATGSSGTAGAASMSLVANTGVMSCGARYDYPTPVATLATPGFAAGQVVTVTDTVGGEPSTKGIKVCFEAAGSSTNHLLRRCHVSNPAPPCLQSLTESGSSVAATFLSPANDPRFWTGGAPVDLRSVTPSSGPPRTTVTIKGKNLNHVASVVIGGAATQISAEHPTKLVVSVPATAVTGSLTLVANSGDVIGSVPFTVTPASG
jgi:hypothetical protein